jgi:hypothetical protein
MLNELREHSAVCPYCGEPIELLVDCSVPQQRYVEDCQVCCRPMNVDVWVDADGEVDVMVSSDSD